MTEAGKGVIDVDGDFSSYNKKLRDANKTASASGASAGGGFTKSFSSSISGGLKNIGSKLATVGKFAALGLAGATAAATGFGVKVAAETETARASFDLFLGSAQKSQVFLTQLQQFAAKTPFEFPELRDAASKLLAVGTQAKDVIPIMSTLGDATASVGSGAEGIDRATTALQQVATKGHVAGDELLQLQEAGIPALEAIAAEMGVSIPEAQKRVSAGLVDAQTLFKALEDKAGKGLQRTTGLMDKQAQTLQGLLSTLKDTVSLNLSNALQPLVGTLKQILPNVSTLAGDLAGTLGNGLAQLAGPLISLVSGLGKVFSPAFSAIIGAVVDLIPSLVQGLAAAGPGFTAFIKAFADIGKVIGPIARILGSVLGTALESLAPVVTILLNALKPLVPILGDALLQAVQAIAPLLPELAKAFADIVASGIVPVFLELLQAVLPLLPLLVKAATVTADLAAGFLKLPGVAKGLAVGILAVVAGLKAYEITTKAVAIAQKLAAAATAIFTVATEESNAAFALNPIGLVVAAVVALGVAVFVAYKKFKPFRDVVDKVGRALSGAFSATVSFLAKELPKLGSAIAGVASIVGRFFVRAFQAAKNALAPLVPVMKTVGTLVVKYLVAPFKAIGDLIHGRFLDAFKDLAVIPLTAIKGLVKFGPQLASLFGKALAGAAQAVASGVQKIGPAFVSLAPKLLAAMVGFDVKLAGVFVRAMAAAAAAVAKGAAALVVFMIELPFRLVDAVTTLGPRLFVAIAGAFAKVLQAEVRGVLALVSFAATLPGRIIRVVASLAPRIASFMVGVFSAVLRAEVRGVSALVSFIATLPGKILRVIASIPGAVVGIVSKAFSLAKTAAMSGIRNVVSEIGKLPGQITHIAGEVLSAAKKIGSNILDGIKSGISAVGGFVSHVAGSIWDAIKGFIDDNLIGPIRDFKVGFFGHHFQPFGSLPLLANGGIFDRPTIGVFGEAGPEMVLPLSPSKGGQRQALLDQAGLGGGEKVHIDNVNLYDQVDVDRFVHTLDFKLRAA